MNYDSDYEIRLTTLAAMGGDATKQYDSVYDIDLEILKLTESGGCSVIDDEIISSGTTWSSTKITDAYEMATNSEIEALFV